MTSPRYCEPRDLYDHGLPRGAVPNPGRLAASALAGTNAITLDAHGFEAGDPIELRAEAGGSLPTPLAEGVTYYVVPLSGSAFSLATSEGGPAIDLTVNGSNVVVIDSLDVKIDKAIEWASRLLDDMLPAHVVPLTAPYPPIVVMTTAELAAAKVVGHGGAVSATLTKIADDARKRLERWGAGVPIRGENRPPAANLATFAAQPSDARGWRRFGGL